ncbi:hypothetical protein D3C71_683730 [compost metagenome]
MHPLTTHSFTHFFRTGTIILFILSGTFITSFAQTYSFSGTIGKYPICLNLNVSGSKVDGYYFYKNKLIDISFSGTYKAGLITVNTTDAFGEAPEYPETFKFKWPSKTPAGTWINNGKSLELKLLPLTTKETGSPKCSNPYFVKENPDISDLTKVKIGLFKLKEDGKPEMINHIKIRYFTEVNTGINLFRIDSGLVADKQKDANFYLENFHLSEFLEALECASYSTSGSDYNFSTSDIHISNELVCFSVFAGFYCGGAHPDETNYGVNYDLNTHKRITSTDYLIADKDALFQKRIVAYLSKMNPEYFNPDAESNPDDLGYDCKYYNSELWTTDCSFTFTHEGLRLHPSFSHYMAPCMAPEWAVIPYSELKELIKPEFYSKLKQLKP